VVRVFENLRVWMFEIRKLDCILNKQGKQYYIAGAICCLAAQSMARGQTKANRTVAVAQPI